MTKKTCGIVLAVILFFAQGCGNETDIRVYEYLEANMDTQCFDYSGETYNMDVGDSYIRAVDKQEKNISYFEKDYNLIYQESWNREFISYSEDIYSAEDENVEFYFRTDTGNLSGILAHEKGIQVTEEKPEGEKDFFALAENVMENYISTDEYELSCTTQVSVIEREGEIGSRSYRNENSFYLPVNETESVEYIFTYTRYIGGYPSSDMARVTFSEEGLLINLIVGEIEGFRNNEVLEVEETIVKKAVGEKLKSICKTKLCD